MDDTIEVNTEELANSAKSPALIAGAVLATTGAVVVVKTIVSKSRSFVRNRRENKRLAQEATANAAAAAYVTRVLK